MMLARWHCFCLEALPVLFGLCSKFLPVIRPSVGFLLRLCVQKNLSLSHSAIHMHAYVHPRMCICTHICTHIRACMCVHARAHTRAHTHVFLGLVLMTVVYPKSEMFVCSFLSLPSTPAGLSMNFTELTT